VIDLETGEQDSSVENGPRWLEVISPSEASLFSHILRGGLLCLIFGVLDNLISKTPDLVAVFHLEFGLSQHPVDSDQV